MDELFRKAAIPDLQDPSRSLFNTVRTRLLNLNWQRCVCHSHAISFTKYDDEDNDYGFMLCVSDKDVVLLQPTESDRQIINRTLGEFNIKSLIDKLQVSC